MPIQECKHSRGEVVFGINNVKTTWMAAQQTWGIGGPTLTRHWANVSWLGHQPLLLFTDLKLCLATATHNLNWLEVV